MYLNGLCSANISPPVIILSTKVLINSFNLFYERHMVSNDSTFIVVGNNEMSGSQYTSAIPYLTTYIYVLRYSC